MDTAAANSATDDVLRLTRCPECGYDLAGLPSEGACPECGNAYDPRYVILDGWARGSTATVMTGTWRDGGWMGLTALFALAGVLPQVLQGRWALAALFVACWLGLVAFAVWYRRRLPRPGIIEVQLGPAGVRKVLTPERIGRPAFVPWRSIARIQLSRVRASRWRIKMPRRIPWWKPEFDPLDAEVRLPDDQVEQLTRHIETIRA